MEKFKFSISQKFLEHIELPVFVKDINGFYRFCNQAFADCFGVPKERILGRTAYDIVPKELADIYTSRDHAFFSHILKETKGDGSKPPTEQLLVSDGVFNKIAMYNENSSIYGFLCIVNLSRMAVSPKHTDDLKLLTEREVEVLNQLVRGKSAKGIARVLDISAHTVTDHLKSIYRKLNVHSKNEALYKGLHLLMSHPRYHDGLGQ